MTTLSLINLAAWSKCRKISLQCFIAVPFYTKRFPGAVDKVFVFYAKERGFEPQPRYGEDGTYWTSLSFHSGAMGIRQQATMVHCAVHVYLRRAWLAVRWVFSSPGRRERLMLWQSPEPILGK